MRNYNVETKFKKDNIWLIWDILFHYMEQLNNPFIATNNEFCPFYVLY